MNRTDRLYAIVEELRGRAPAPLRAADLAGRFEVSVRTIERDLAALSQAGVPLWSQPGPGGGYALDPDTTLPPLNFTADEATAIAAALAAARSGPFNDAARSALAKIAAVMSASRLSEADALGERIRVADHGRTPPADPAVARAVREALRGSRALEIEYSDQSGAETRRTVEPSGLLAARGGWYLFGWCRLRDGGRGFRLDRIRTARVTDEVIVPRPLEELLTDVPIELRRAGLREDASADRSSATEV